MADFLVEPITYLSGCSCYRPYTSSRYVVWYAEYRCVWVSRLYRNQLDGWTQRATIFFFIQLDVDSFSPHPSTLALLHDSPSLFLSCRVFIDHILRHLFISLVIALMFFFFNYVYSCRTMQYNSNRCLYLMESYNFNHANTSLRWESS